jgi:hypothetical protein
MDGRWWTESARRTEPNEWMLTEIGWKLMDVEWWMTMRQPRCYITIRVHELCNDDEPQRDDHDTIKQSTSVSFAMMANGHGIAE